MLSLEKSFIFLLRGLMFKYDFLTRLSILLFFFFVQEFKDVSVECSTQAQRTYVVRRTWTVGVHEATL